MKLIIDPTLGRYAGMGVFLFMIAWQVFRAWGANFDTVGWIRWSLVTILFAQFLGAYIVRTAARSPAQGWKELIFPFFCAALPIAIIESHHSLYRWLPQDIQSQWLPLWMSLSGKSHPWALLGMAIGEIITIAGMLTLRGSFSIATEARELKTQGLYAWIRHPLYTGEMISIVAWSCHWPSPLAWGGTIIFLVLQVWRAMNEEKKLASVFPEYPDYAKGVGRFLPKIFAQKSQDSDT